MILVNRPSLICSPARSLTSLAVAKTKTPPFRSCSTGGCRARYTAFAAPSPDTPVRTGRAPFDASGSPLDSSLLLNIASAVETLVALLTESLQIFQEVGHACTSEATDRYFVVDFHFPLT